MKILVDADACPVVSIVEHVASKYRIPVILLSDTNHVLQSAYSEVKVVGAGADAVDFALVGLCQKGDLVVTQDYGVAAMILRKEAYGIHQSGKWHTDENIDRMLMERHISKKVRHSKSKHHMKGPAKRMAEDDTRFIMHLGHRQSNNRLTLSESMPSHIPAMTAGPISRIIRRAEKGTTDRWLVQIYLVTKKVTVYLWLRGGYFLYDLYTL